MNGPFTIHVSYRIRLEFGFERLVNALVKGLQNWRQATRNNGNVTIFCLAERSLTSSVNYEKNPIPKVLASVVCESKILILIQSFVPTNRPSDRVR